jgi:hypothetical protein
VGLGDFCLSKPRRRVPIGLVHADVYNCAQMLLLIILPQFYHDILSRPLPLPVSAVILLATTHFPSCRVPVKPVHHESRVVR